MDAKQDNDDDNDSVDSANLSDSDSSEPTSPTSPTTPTSPTIYNITLCPLSPDILPSAKDGLQSPSELKQVSLLSRCY